MTLGDIIREYRKEHDMSMDAFAAKSGLSKAYISLLEKNQHPKTGKPIAPSVETIRLVADAMGIDFNDLFMMIDGYVSLVPENPTDGPEQEECYHINSETREIAQYIYENAGMRLLFDAARGNDPKNLKLAAEMLRRMKDTNSDG